MNNRPTINSDTFENIFKNKEELLEDMVKSLTRENNNKFKNRITSDKNNPNNLRYIISMIDDNTINIIDTKTNNNTIIHLN